MAIAAPPPLPPPAISAPAPYEVSFGRVAGRAPKGATWIAVRAGGRLVATQRLTHRRFELLVALPQREQTVRVTTSDARGRRSFASVPHVLGLPAAARPRGSLAHVDPALSRRIVPLTRSFPGSSAVYVRDLRTGAGAAWNARAQFPAASTLKLAIAVTALSRLSGKPGPGSYADSLFRRALIYSDNDAANSLEVLFGGSTSGGSALVNALMRGLGLVDSEMYGGYERGTAARKPIPLRSDEQPYYGRGKHTSAYDLVQLFAYVHLATAGKGRLAKHHPGFTPADARYLLYVLVESADRGKLDRFLGGRGATVAHKAGWIASAKHDAGLVYWRGGVYVVAVMTHGYGVGTASDVLAGRVALRTLDRLAVMRSVGSARSAPRGHPRRTTQVVRCSADRHALQKPPRAGLACLPPSDRDPATPAAHACDRRPRLLPPRAARRRRAQELLLGDACPARLLDRYTDPLRRASPRRGARCGTVVFVSHALELMERFCDRCLLLQSETVHALSRSRQLMVVRLFVLGHR